MKTDAAIPELETIWQEKGDILRNQLAFDTTTTATLRAYTNSREFVDNYPFVPWHYQILQKVFESIRTKGAAGKQLAMGSALCWMPSSRQLCKSPQMVWIVWSRSGALLRDRKLHGTCG